MFEGSNVRDEMGTVFAGLKDRNVGDRTGIALAATVRENIVLQSLVLAFEFSSVGDATGTAFVEAVKENAVLLSLELTFHERICQGRFNGTKGVFYPASDVDNVIKAELQRCIVEALKRNCGLTSQWLPAACFARHAVSRAYLGMPEKDFRRAVFDFFLPESTSKRLVARAAARRAMNDASTARPTTEVDRYQGPVRDSTDEYEVIQAMENVVMDSIEHVEPPAIIDEHEAAQVVAVQHAGFVERNLGVDGNFEEPEPEVNISEFEKIYLLTFTRHPREFERTLHEGRELEQVRAEMVENGLSPRLPSGAAIFVIPEQYQHALGVVAPLVLKHRHVIVSESCAPLVLEAVGALASRLKVKLRSMDILAYVSSTEEADVFQVENTFLNAAPRVLRNPWSVVQSTGPAHGALNPRRHDMQ